MYNTIKFSIFFISERNKVSRDNNKNCRVSIFLINERSELIT